MRIRAQRVLLESAARTVATACPVQNDVVARGVRLYLNVSGASGTGGLTVQIRGYDRASGNTARLLVGPVAITGVGLYVYEMLDSSVSANEGDVVHAISRPLPVIWDVNVAVGDATSYTYSLSAELT